MAHLHSINRIDLENYKILKHTPKHQRTRFHSIIHPHPQLLAFSFLSLSFPFHFLISLPSLSWLCLLQISHILHLFFCSLKKPSMAKTVLLIALCLLLALAVESRPMKNPFVVEGKVYCDTCRAGFETSATTYIPGARIRIECVDRNAPSKVLFRKETTTDSAGCYSMLVAEDHGNQICDAVVVSSPQLNCAKAAPGRDRARVILTGYNGIASEKRMVNNIGFEMDQPLALCSNVLKQYQETEYEN